MYIGLVLLAHSAVFDILLDKLCKARPLELGGNELASLEVAGVTSGLIAMASNEDGAMEGVVQGNVDTPFICENMVVIFPV